MVLAALLTIAYVEYSSNIAAVVKGTVTVANGYGSPAVVEFFTNFRLPLHADSITPVEPLPAPDNSSAHYSLTVTSGQTYVIVVLVSAPGSEVSNYCEFTFIPSCTDCQGPVVKISLGTTVVNYDFVVSCFPRF